MLLIDAGNTRIKWAIAPEADIDAVADTATDVSINADDMRGSWLHSGSIARADWMQLEAAWRAACGGGQDKGQDKGQDQRDGTAATLRRVLISNVAGAALRDQLEGLLRRINPDPALRIEWLASQAALGGVRNGYRQPAQLGCDRFASAIAAHALFPGRALIVATCGTATTIDAITPQGDFIGGMILPGLGLMATSLALNTAQLPQLQQLPQAAAIAAATHGFADNTEQAIVAGCIAAQTGAIERALRQHRRQYPDTLCLLAGGAGEYLTAHLAEPHERLDNLVLIGLHVLANRYPNGWNSHLC